MGSKSIAAQTLGQMGGWATRDKYGKEHFKKLQERSVEVRKANAAKKKTAS